MQEKKIKRHKTLNSTIFIIFLSLCGVLLCCPGASSAAPGVANWFPGINSFLASKADSPRAKARPVAPAGTKKKNKATSKKPESPSLTIATRSLIHKDDNCSVMVSYPQVGNEKIDTELDFWANKTVSTFVSGIESFISDEANRYSMLVDYELSETSGRFISIVFRISTETGGSHPDSGMTTFTYDLSDGRKLEMHDIFGDASGLLQYLSMYSYETLLGSLGQEFENSIKLGTSPNILNFSLFSLRPDGLVLYFPPYQVADYDHGEQQVSIKANSLKAYKPRSDLWRSSAYGALSEDSIMQRPDTLEPRTDKKQLYRQ